MSAPAHSPLSAERIRDLLTPFAVVDGSSVALSQETVSKFATYLEVLLRWNGRTNLTSVRDPEQIVKRHFGEGVFAALWLGKEKSGVGLSMLDFGSGAGIPGLPMQIVLPTWNVVLAESQGKKAAFLREAVRSLHLSTQVWSDRVEVMSADRRFDVVTMRAVDHMEAMRSVAMARVAPGGLLLEFVGAHAEGVEIILTPSREVSRMRVTRA